MPNTSLYTARYESFLCNEQVANLLQQFGSYDDPCFFLIYSTDTTATLVEYFLNEGLSFDLNVDAVITVDDNTLFVSADINKTKVKLLTDETMAFLSNNGDAGRISAFRHNCLGDAKDTFKMAVVQLQDAMDAKDSSAFALINDFTDRANWPGYDRYEELDESDEEVATQTRGDASSDANAMAEDLLPFELSQPLMDIAPFIYTLPLGDQLWRYVLTGEGREQLDQQNALLDLDHILVYLHARNNAPEFLKTLKREVPQDSIPTQEEIRPYLDDILEDLADELLDADDNKTLRQGIYLRILDIFFHLFDQMPLDKDVRKRLVEDDDHGFLTEEAFTARFQLNEAVKGANELTPAQERSIKEALDALEDYYSFSLDDFQQVEKLWQESRNVCNPNLWDIDDVETELLLAAMFLALDVKSGFEDDKTQALREFVNEHLFSRIIETVSSSIDYEQSLPTAFSSWLNGEDIDFDTLIVAMKECLRIDYRSDLEAKQPIYDLMESTDDFAVVLASCYWLKLAGKNAMAERLIKLFLALAPQVTLSNFARPYSSFFRGFEVEKYEKDFYQSLAHFDIKAEDIFAFRVRMAKKEMADQYLALIKEYFAADVAQRALLDQGLQKILPKDYQRFYVNLWLTDQNFAFPVANELQEVWGEVNLIAKYMDNEAFVAAFAARSGTTAKGSGILFANYDEFLPDKYDLSYKPAANIRDKKQGLDCSLVRFLGDHHEVLVGKMSDDGERLQANNLIILDSWVDPDVVLSVYEALPGYHAREQIVAESLTHYLAGQISFADYQEKTKGFINTKEYGLDMENYNPYEGRILPFIQTEKDTERKLRFIKVLTAHPTMGKRVLADICFELFLDQAYSKGSISLKDRYSVDVDDLNSKAKQTLAAFQQNVQQKLAAMV